MMIDASAIVAIAFHEPAAARMTAAIAAAPTRLMSAVSWLEAMMVIEARAGAAAAEKAELNLVDLEVVAIPFDREQMLEAQAAWRRFGKGRHPAKLNLGVSIP